MRNYTDNIVIFFLLNIFFLIIFIRKVTDSLFFAKFSTDVNLSKTLHWWFKWVFSRL